MLVCLFVCYTFSLRLGGTDDVSEDDNDDPELHKYFFAFLLKRIFFNERTYFWVALPLNYISIFFAFLLYWIFFMSAPIF